MLETLFSSETDDLPETLLTKSDAETAAISSLKMQKKKIKLLEADRHLSLSTETEKINTQTQLSKKYSGAHPNLDSSIGSSSAWYHGDCGIKSWQGIVL